MSADTDLSSKRWGGLFRVVKREVNHEIFYVVQSSYSYEYDSKTLWYDCANPYGFIWDDVMARSRKIDSAVRMANKLYQNYLKGKFTSYDKVVVE